MELKNQVGATVRLTVFEIASLPRTSDLLIVLLYKQLKYLYVIQTFLMVLVCCNYCIAFSLVALVSKKTDGFVICHPSPNHVESALHFLSKRSCGCGCLISGFF